MFPVDSLLYLSLFKVGKAFVIESLNNCFKAFAILSIGKQIPMCIMGMLLILAMVSQYAGSSMVDFSLKTG